MKTFNHVEIFVRLSKDGYEGQTLRFVTLNEDSAINRFTTDDNSEVYAPDYSGEVLQIWVDGEYIETYTRTTDKKWVKNYYSNNPEEYGTVKIAENRTPYP